MFAINIENFKKTKMQYIYTIRRMNWNVIFFLGGGRGGGLINNIEEYQKIYNHAWRNYLIEEINNSKLMNKKYIKICRVLNYIDHSLILISTITGCIFISAFGSLVGIPIGITSSGIGLKFV